MTAEGDKEHRLAAWQRGADTGRRTARQQVLRQMKGRLCAAQSLAWWATADGVPSDFWDARVGAYMDMIEEIERSDGRGWWR